MRRRLAVLAVSLSGGAVYAASPADGPLPHVTDSALVDNVRTSLQARLGAATREIDVRAQDGFVFLYGEAPSERLRARAETIAERVAGVRAVSNELVAANRDAALRPILGRSVPRRLE